MTAQELAARIKIDQDFFNNVLRSDLTPEQKERALQIGRIEFKSAGATRKR